MKKHIAKNTFIVLLAVLVFVLTACTPSSDNLNDSLLGEWGRLGETMHIFNADGSCVIGGMQGTFRIDNDNNLILTTMSGAEVIYEFAESKSKAETENYWYLSEDTITVNGNTFTRIIEEETPTNAD